MRTRTLNIIGTLLTAAGLLLLLGVGVPALFRGQAPALTPLMAGAVALVAVGSAGALLPDSAYRSPLRGLRRVNPFRLAYGALVFLFGFVLFGAVAWFLFWPVAQLNPPLYVGAGAIGAGAMAVGGRALFTEPDGSVYIPTNETN